MAAERVEWEWLDAAGNRVTVEVLTSAVAQVTFYDDDQKPMNVAKLLLTPDAAQQLADAVRKACTE